MWAVNISMLYVISLCILHYAPTDSILYWKVCYIHLLFRDDYFTAPELYLNFYWYVFASYNGVCIDMFVSIIKYNFWLYFILGILSYIFTIYGLFFQFIVVTFTILLICLWMLYICLLRYVGVINKIFSLVLLRHEKLVMHISCI